MGQPVSVGLLFDASAETKARLDDLLPEGISLQQADPSDPACLVGFDIAIGWRTTAEQLLAADRLGLWINPGAGVQHLIAPFRQAAATREVTLVNCHANSCATAQHAVALLLALANRIVPHHNWMAAGRWRMGDESAASVPLRGRKVGLLGYGAVNRQVHRFLSGFDLSFMALRRSASDAPDDSLQQFLPNQLDTFLVEADLLVAALPLTDATRGMIGSKQLALLGPDALLVNIARGPVIEEQALYRALAGGTIAGAALDVWYDYDPAPDGQQRRYPFTYPFHELPNVVLSPHRAASPLEDPARWDEVAGIIRRYAAGEPLLNVVDLDRGY